MVAEVNHATKQMSRVKNGGIRWMELIFIERYEYEDV